MFRRVHVFSTAAARQERGEELVCPGWEGRVDRTQTSRQPTRHTAVRVGVLGWFRRSVLHNQPAKSTSSPSDRLMKAWFCKGRRDGVNSQVSAGKRKAPAFHSRPAGHPERKPEKLKESRPPATGRHTRDGEKPNPEQGGARPGP